MARAMNVPVRPAGCAKFLRSLRIVVFMMLNINFAIAVCPLLPKSGYCLGWKLPQGGNQGEVYGQNGYGDRILERNVSIARCSSGFVDLGFGGREPAAEQGLCD